MYAQKYVYIHEYIVILRPHTTVAPKRELDVLPAGEIVRDRSDITRGQEVAVVYDSGKGFLFRPEMCNQRFHVEWGNYNIGSKVISFHCGCFDCPESEQWDLYTDGTVRPRQHSHFHLAIGIGNTAKGMWATYAPTWSPSTSSAAGEIARRVPPLEAGHPHTSIPRTATHDRAHSNATMRKHAPQP